jgi:hypothetical protein
LFKSRWENFKRILPKVCSSSISKKYLLLIILVPVLFRTAGLTAHGGIALDWSAGRPEDQKSAAFHSFTICTVADDRAKVVLTTFFLANVLMIFKSLSLFIPSHVQQGIIGLGSN